jgi:hypothetical protein
LSVLLVRPITKTESAYIRKVMQNEGAGNDYALVEAGGRLKKL